MKQFIKEYLKKRNSDYPSDDDCQLGFDPLVDFEVNSTIHAGWFSQINLMEFIADAKQAGFEITRLQLSQQGQDLTIEFDCIQTIL